MTDYPTAAEIDAASMTISRLRSHVGEGVALAWPVLTAALSILNNLDDIPGLHSPEPEPVKRTPYEVLRDAWRKTLSDSLEEAAIDHASRYARDYPEWFADWHAHDTARWALRSAASRAYAAGDYIACRLLDAAAEVATANPAWFGDE